VRHGRTGVSTDFACRVAGVSSTLALDDDGLVVDGRRLSWLDVDDVRYANHELDFLLPDVTSVAVTHLGARFDECARTVRELRGAARRPALTQSALPAIAAFEAREGTGSSIVDVTLFPHVLSIEPRGGPAICLPLPLIMDVERDGWTFRLRNRGLPDVTVRGLGARTDEFVLRLAEARSLLSAATAAGYAEYEPGLGALAASDGWAVDESAAGARWPVLQRTWLSLARAQAALDLAARSEPGRLRLGLWTEGGTVRLPFLLASRGSGSGARTVVEAVDADDRATFVFATDDLDRLNAVLILTAFRREALSLPDPELGRWAVAVRTQEPVRWARERLVARIVHDAGWSSGVTSALG
jgi:hypothetical protein